VPFIALEAEGLFIEFRGRHGISTAQGAQRIIEAAQSGERDPEKLRDWALTAFGRKQS